MKKLKKEYEFPIYIFNKGENYRSYEFFGCHRIKGSEFAFRVWAPNAVSISVAGDFNGWNESANVMEQISPGIWEAVIDGISMTAINMLSPRQTGAFFTKPILTDFTVRQDRAQLQKFTSLAAINGKTQNGRKKA